MPVPQCLDLMRIAETLLREDREFQAEIKQLVASDGNSSEITEAFARRFSPDDAATLREEFEHLPRWLFATMMRMWVQADGAGKAFHLRSVMPRSTMQFARKLRVELAIITDEDGVTVELSHIPGRHARWYRPAEEAVATR